MSINMSIIGPSVCPQKDICLSIVGPSKFPYVFLSKCPLYVHGMFISMSIICPSVCPSDLLALISPFQCSSFQSIYPSVHLSNHLSVVKRLKDVSPFNYVTKMSIYWSILNIAVLNRDSVFSNVYYLVPITKTNLINYKDLYLFV